MKFPAESGVYFEARVLATSVKFDVAVTAETKERNEVGGGLKVMVLSARAGTEATTTDTTVSRVQFAVPLVFPRNTQSWNASPHPSE